MKYTPGPWEIGKFWPSSKREELSECEITPVGEFAILAHVYRPDRSKEEAEANAHLIAAAPELLEACIKMYDHIFNRQCQTDIEIADMRDYACDAITKAEGK